MIVEREIPIYWGFSHIPSVCIGDTGFGLCVVLVKFLESDTFIDTESTPFVFRRLYWKGIHRMPLRLLHKDVEVRIYLGGVSAFCRYLDLSMPPDTSIISWGLTATPTATTQGHASVWPSRPSAGRGKCLRKHFQKRSEEERYQCDSANFQKHVWLSEIEVKNGEQEGIRTPGLQLRRLLPYPD